MKSIANIITESKFENNGYYNVVSDEKLCIDGIPTLIIGWDKAKQIYPEANIIEWEINENTYWTFGNRERRDVYEKNLIRFQKIATDRFIKSLKYSFVNVMTEPKEHILKFIESLKNDTKKTVYITNDIMYVYYEGKKNIVGISLRDVEYMGYSTAEFFASFYEGKNNTLIKEVSYDIKNRAKNNQYIIPYLYSI